MLARQALGAGDRQQYDKHKRSLPLFVFMAGNIHGTSRATTTASTCGGGSRSVTSTGW